MKKFLVACILSLAVIGCIPPQVETYLDQTVQVYIERDGNIRGHGSGVIVEDGILTAGHVVNTITDDDRIMIKYRDGHTAEVTIDKLDYWREQSSPRADLALLTVEEPYKYRAAEIECSAPTLGDNVYVVGNPLNMRWVLTRGYVTSLVPREDQAKGAWIQTDATVTKGNSGGPMFNKKGKVIGIVSHGSLVRFGMSQAPAGFNFGVSGERICAFLDVRPDRYGNRNVT